MFKCIHIEKQKNDSEVSGWFYIELHLSLFSLQLFQLCFTHFGSAKNFQVFLWRDQRNNELSPFLFGKFSLLVLKMTHVMLPCEGLRVADVELDSLYWETVSYTASMLIFSSLSACPGLYHHHQVLLLPPQGHCLHCRQPQGHTNHTKDKHT